MHSRSVSPVSTSAGYDICTSERARESSPSLLYYLPTFQAVVCKPCGFAIQPNAIPQHLKAKHKIYRRQRDDLLRQIRKLSVGDPSRIDQTRTLSSPIPHIPVLEGLACVAADCDYLCASLKRMKMHWTNRHQRLGHEGYDWETVRVQTLFRGTCIRYMRLEDAASRNSTPQEDISESNNTLSPTVAEAESRENNASPKSPALPSAPLPTTSLSTHPDLNLSDLSFFYFYLTNTGSSLYLGYEPTNYYTKAVPQMACECPWLMRLVIATASLHKAITLPSTQADERDAARNLASQYHLALPSYQTALQTTADSKASQYVVGFSRMLIVTHCASLSLQTRIDLTSNASAPDAPSADSKWDLILNHVQLVRGTSLWAKSHCHEQVCETPLPLVTETEHPYDWTESAQLHTLHPLHLLSELRSEKDQSTRDTLLQMFRIYSSCINASSADLDPAESWPVLWRWASNMSPAFFEILRAKNAHALVLLGYISLLLRQVRCFWFMRHMADILLQTIMGVRPELRGRLSKVREVVDGDFAE